MIGGKYTQVDQDSAQVDIDRSYLLVLGLCPMLELSLAGGGINIKARSTRGHKPRNANRATGVKLTDPKLLSKGGRTESSCVTIMMVALDNV